jgi:phage gp36-like protein
MFLRRTDYLKQIRNENLEVVVGGDDSIRKDAELAAQAEIESYLRHRYDMAKIFVDLLSYDSGDTYNTGDLITFPDVEDEIYSAVEDALTGVSPVDDPTKWTKGDTRNPLIKMHLVDMTLYHLHSRINPRNIPEFRIARRDDCISWLKMVAKGQITVDLPILLPEEDKIGLKIKHGSNEKFNHNF